jgi:hypothetical protein
MAAKTITLKYPILVDGKETAVLAVSRLKTKHLKLFPKEFLRKIGSGGVKKLSLDILPELLPLFAAIMNITPEQADEIDFEDLMQVAELMGDLLGN